MKSKKFFTKFKEDAKGWQVTLSSLILPLVLIILILSLVVVGIGNHALFYNTKFYESVSLLYKKPDAYSLSDMKVDIDSTYYSIKQVVYVMRSVGTQYSIADGILTQPYFLGMYSQVWLVVGVSLIYIVLELLKSLAVVGGVVYKVKSNKWWGRGFVLACILFVILVLELLFPLL